MRRHQDRAAFFAQSTDQLEQHLAVLPIQAVERLVKEQELRVRDERAREDPSLLLTTRKLPEAATREGPQAHTLQRLGHCGTTCPPDPAEGADAPVETHRDNLAERHRKGDVAAVGLGKRPDLPPRAGGGFAQHLDPARREIGEPEHTPQQCRLA